MLAAFARILLCRLVFEDGLLAAGAADEAAAPLLPLLLCQPDTFQVRRAPRPCPPFAARDSLLRGPETDAPSVTPALQHPARHLSQEVGLGLLARVRDPAHQGLLRGALEVGPAPRMERPGAESRANGGRRGTDGQADWRVCSRGWGRTPRWTGTPSAPSAGTSARASSASAPSSASASELARAGLTGVALRRTTPPMMMMMAIHDYYYYITLQRLYYTTRTVLCSVCISIIVERERGPSAVGVPGRHAGGGARSRAALPRPGGGNPPRPSPPRYAPARPRAAPPQAGGTGPPARRVSTREGAGAGCNGE